jgi:hypothetical protein
MKDAVALANLVIEWWREHQYDTDNSGEYNLYDAPPEFVLKAIEIHDRVQSDD